MNESKRMNALKFIIDCKLSNDIFPRNDVGLEMMGVIPFQSLIESFLYIEYVLQDLILLRQWGL
jgi:hypothetical protein